MRICYLKLLIKFYLKTSSLSDTVFFLLCCPSRLIKQEASLFSDFSALMTACTRSKVLSLYTRVFRVARTWQAQSGVKADTETERKYIKQEARTLFRQNQQLTDPEVIKTRIAECEARLDIGLHYSNPYPRATYLPPLGLATLKGRNLGVQQRLRKQAKPIYLQSHDET
uniref:LYR motif containing 1 n=2 Tax=Oryzias latipes TaxID=8090 RepID=A0A3P9KJY9_ORYLA